jgi:hypothetical protein
LQELQVADEPLAHAVGEASRAIGRAEHLAHRLHLADEEVRRAHPNGFQPEPLRAERHQVEPAVGIAGRLADLGQRPHRGHGQLSLTDLTALADQHDAERAVVGEARLDHRLVAVFEDVERQGDARAQHRVQRKERQVHHRALVARRGTLIAGSNSPRKRRSRRVTPTASSCADRNGPATSQWEQDLAVPASSAVRKLEPQPQPETAFGLLTVKPAPMSVST